MLKSMSSRSVVPKSTLKPNSKPWASNERSTLKPQRKGSPFTPRDFALQAKEGGVPSAEKASSADLLNTYRRQRQAVSRAASRTRAEPSAAPEVMQLKPDRLKTGPEHLSGMELSGIRMHYNSPKAPNNVDVVQRAPIGRYIQRQIEVGKKVRIIDRESVAYGRVGTVSRDNGNGNWVVAWNENHGARYKTEQLTEIKKDGILPMIREFYWSAEGFKVPEENFGKSGISDGNVSEKEGVGDPANVSMNEEGEWEIDGVYWLFVQWGVKDDKGPAGQINIESANSEHINQENYKGVAEDLTPNKSDYGGRPSRIKYWSKSICEKHEKYHVEDYILGAKQAFPQQLKAHFYGKTADSKEKVYSQIDNFWYGMQGSINAHMDESSETRAYTDGSDDYESLANSIREKGAKGEYS